MRKTISLNKLSILLVAVFSVFTIWLYMSVNHSALRFSDAAKFADVARNMYQGEGFVSHFSFFDANRLFILGGESIKNGGILLGAVLPVYVSYLVLGVNDFAVILPSLLSFVAVSIAVYALSNKLFSKGAALMAAISIALNLNFLDYATSGASEVLFALQILATYYLISLNKRSTDALSLFMFFIMYITRPQAFIFIAGGLLYLLLNRFKLKKALIIFIALGSVAFLVDWFILPRISSSFIYSITGRGQYAAYYQAAGENTSNNLRGSARALEGVSGILKKAFYNLYNLYKFLPRIAPWFVWPMFFVSPIIFNKKKNIFNFVLVTYFTFLTTIIVVSISTPLFRYIHPVIPLIYIVSFATLYEIIRKYVKNRYYLISILIFAVILATGIESVGAMVLDSRAKNKTVNLGKPPTHQALSTALKDRTEDDSFIITNLDTWATWYGERNTMWFPNSPEAILPTDKSKHGADYVYLTNYLIDDNNYYMDAEWRSIMNQTNPSHEFFDYYEYVDTFHNDASQVYENKQAVGVLFRRK